MPIWHLLVYIPFRFFKEKFINVKKGNPGPFGLVIKTVLLKREYKQKLLIGSNPCFLTIQMTVPFNKLPCIVVQHRGWSAAEPSKNQSQRPETRKEEKRRQRHSQSAASPRFAVPGNSWHFSVKTQVKNLRDFVQKSNNPYLFKLIRRAFYS